MTHIPNHPRIEMMRRVSLTPNPKNARRRGDEQVSQIARAVERFGFLVPIVVALVEGVLMICAGHGRWAAAALLGMDEVPVIRAEFLTEEDRRAFALAENRLGDLSDWDEAKLGEELKFLYNQNYDLSLAGFSIGDIDFTLGGEEPADEELDVIPVPGTVAISRVGDRWSMGPHRLFCGSACNVDSFEILLGDDRATMIFSDPPYNVPISGHVSGLGKVKHREFAEASGEMSPGEFTTFLRTVFRHCVRFSLSGSIHFQCMDWRHIREMLDAADGVYTTFKQLVVWNKGSGSMGTFYRGQHELIFVFKSGTERHINNFGLGETGRYRTNVWDHKGLSTFGKGRQQDLADHPTIKPLALVMDAILDCSRPGDLILDPFSGSSTTLLAAHRTKRIGAAIELDPLYVDVGLRRMAEATGLTPILSDGRAFDEVAADRKAEEANDV